MNVHYDFSGEVLAVTGGASGIGAGICQAYAEAGGTVYCLDVNDKQLADMESYRPDNGRIVCRAVDVSDSKQVDDLFREISQECGRLDGLIMSAAIQPRTDIEHMPDDEWRQVMDVNLGGAFYCTRAAIPIMKKQRHGAIVTFSSGLASQGWASASAYATTKAGLIAYTRSLARELLPYHVRANVIAPGVTDSPLFTGPNSKEEQEFFRRRVGSVGTVGDVVKLLMFLVSDASASLTGSLVNRELIFPED